LISYESGKRIRNLAQSLIRTFKSEIKVYGSIADKIVVGTAAILSRSSGKRISSSKFGDLQTSPIYFESGDLSNSRFQFFAAIQPMTSIGQKIITILDKLRDIPGVSVQLLAAGEYLERDQEKLPLLRFYQFAFQAIPQFDNFGMIKHTPVSFARLPRSALMTLGMDIPDAWLIRPIKSVYDLDNIKLSNVPEGNDLEAEFALENLLIQGHATDSATQAPPRGLQFVLGTASNEAMVDTITMANLGYLQLKGGPGVWNLSIRKGRSDEVFKLEEINQGAKDKIVLVDSFEDITVHPKVSKRAGMQDQDVLVDQGSEVDSGIWGSVKNKMFGHRAKSTDKTVINVFSVASGHLYERFLAIMMLSVKKATKNPVKFWLIENFLSPSFLEFLPHLSKAFEFDYELVTCNFLLM
jgi:UDP-glucose:glycoprotein glucosyltransferase